MICSDNKHYRENCSQMIDKFVERGYTKNIIKNEIRKVENINRKELIEKQKRKDNSRIPLCLTYSRNMPPISKHIIEKWNILQINENFKNIFKENPIVAYRKNKSIKEIIGGNTIVNNKVYKSKINQDLGQCKPCNTNRPSLCCKQVVNTDTFQSVITKKVYQIYHRVDCKSKYVIYLLECTICNIQYIGKSETQFNIRLNNHRKDVKNPNSIPVCKHFNEPGHNFSTHAKFIIIEQLRNTNNISKAILSERLKDRENFWIKTLKTLKPNGFNQEFN